MGEKGFKGFKPGLVCKNKQYAENTVFEEDTFYKLIDGKFVEVGDDDFG